MDASIDGGVAPGWTPVENVFREILSADGGAGSALCVYVDGNPVVDVWGGTAGPARRWQQDTAAVVFSATKGLAALCVHLLVQQGRVDLDAPVAQYWPEFANGGKQDLPVRWVLSHQAGLIGVDGVFTREQALAGDAVLRALEAQRPLWEPGTAHGYHAFTYGYLVGELVRRVTGISLGRFFGEQFAIPLRLNAHLGLPLNADVDVAELARAEDEADVDILATLIAQDPDGPIARMMRAVSLGGAFSAPLHKSFNDRSVLVHELPAAGLVSDARSLARAYASAVSAVDGVRLLSPDTAAGCAVVQTASSPVYGMPEGAPKNLDFGPGFLVGPMLGETSFGHPGASGALGFADVASAVGFGYVPRLMRADATDTRAARLAEAVRKVLRGR